MKEVIHKEIRIKTDRQTLFRALTSPQALIEVWPITRATIGEKTGAPVVLEGDGFRDEGVVTDRQEGRVFEYAYWSTTHGTEPHDRNRVSIRYEIVEDGDRVRLIVRQWNLPGDEYRVQMAEVWDDLLLALKRSLQASD